MCSEVGIEYPDFRRKKVCNNPFADLSNPDVLYWLGWLATDGYISHKETRVTLSLSIKDIDVIEKFRDTQCSHQNKIKAVLYIILDQEIIFFMEKKILQ